MLSIEVLRIGQFHCDGLTLQTLKEALEKRYSQLILIYGQIQRGQTGPIVKIVCLLNSSVGTFHNGCQSAVTDIHRKSQKIHLE